MPGAKKTEYCMSKLTQWFDGSKFNPGSFGVYEVNHPIFGVMYQVWDGVVWYAITWNRGDAWEYAKQKRVSVEQSPVFRGLNVKPD